MPSTSNAISSPFATSQLLSFFDSGEHSIHVLLRRLHRPRLLWLNCRAAQNEEPFHRLGCDLDAYAEHLLQSCAYIIPDEESEQFLSGDETIGVVDRYGGEGISTNGGSGRAAHINGYLVKGIGRTPLVSSISDRAHASGGAYLEEAVRETIFAEIISAEFPYSAVPTLAIIDTGIIQEWPKSFVPSHEPRVLIVRSVVLRPAHFLRAPYFLSANRFEGSLDQSRVGHMVKMYSLHLGSEALVFERLQQFLFRWAEQLAYSYVHRLSVGANTSSNINIGGALLDFGAATHVPSWAPSLTVLGSERTGSEFDVVVRTTVSLIQNVSKALGPSAEKNMQYEFTIKEAFARFSKRISEEALRLCGLSRKSIAQHRKHYGIEKAWLGFSCLKRHYSSEFVDLLELSPSLRIPWEIDRIFDENPPSYLQPLANVMKEISGKASERSILANPLLRIDRDSLFRERLRYQLHLRLKSFENESVFDAKYISDLIFENVAKGRRDVHFEQDGFITVGFAVATDFTVAIYRSCNPTPKIFGHVEWCSTRIADFFPIEEDLMEIYIEGPNEIRFICNNLKVSCALAMHVQIYTTSFSKN